MTAPNRHENARAEAALGDDALRAAEELRRLGLANDAVSRAYYAGFHYARALLLTKGLEPKTHRGVLSLLEKHFGADARLGREGCATLARLQTFRGLADYDSRERFTQERADDEVAAAKGFVERAREILKALGPVE